MRSSGGYCIMRDQGFASPMSAPAARQIDVAIQSFRKPDSLLYALMTLQRVAGSMIDTVWVADDRSGDGSVELLRSERIRDYFASWTIQVRENSVRTAWSHVRVDGSRYRWSWLERKKVNAPADDVRYQWAIRNTAKRYLFICHDDIEFRADIVSTYLERMRSGVAIVGDLGQCWRCGFYGDGRCGPARLVAGERPKRWPRTPSVGSGPWACRVNEWCALIDVEAARTVGAKTGVLFGNYYRGADCGAYWFKTAVSMGYGFDDPLAPETLGGPDDRRPDFYLHGWQGHSGHSVWQDQGQGLARYDAATVRRRIIDAFGTRPW